MAVLGGASWPGCGDDQSLTRSDDAGPRRRIPPPSEVEVKVLDHEIHPGGVGPYLLGASLREVLAKLPHGPRAELFQVEGVVPDYNLVKTERERVVIGVRKPGGVSFVTILGEDIAKTEKEVAVGSPVTTLEEAHGLLRARAVASDPRILRPVSMPGVRFFPMRGIISAIVVQAPPTVSLKPDTTCGAAALEARRDEIALLAGLGEDARVDYGCFSGEGPEALVVGEGRLAVVGAPGGKLKRVAGTVLANLIYAAALETDGDGRDEILAVVQSRSDSVRTVSVQMFAVEGGRLVTLVQQDVYQLDDRAVSWTGARPSEVELLIEAEGKDGLMTVGGYYVQRSMIETRAVIPLAPVPVVVKQRKLPADHGRAAGSLDAGVPPDAAARSGSGRRSRDAGGSPRPRESARPPDKAGSGARSGRETGPRP